jgi:thiol-disulfide isomerase/thioredoxin
MLRVLAIALLLAAPVRAADLAPFAGTPDAPALALSGLDGKRHDLAALRGRVAVVNFWATWCAPCIREFRAMQRAQAALAAEGVVFLAVNAGQRRDIVARFVDRLGIRLAVLLDPDKAAGARWFVRALPISYVVAPSGKVVLGAIGDHAWDSPETLDRLRALAKSG